MGRCLDAARTLFAGPDRRPWAAARLPVPRAGPAREGRAFRRDRIAADLQDKVIQQVFAVGMNLQSTAMLAAQPKVRERILAAADGLDQVLQLTRDAVFDLE